MHDWKNKKLTPVQVTGRNCDEEQRKWIVTVSSSTRKSRHSLVWQPPLPVCLNPPLHTNTHTHTNIYMLTYKAPQGSGRSVVLCWLPVVCRRHAAETTAVHNCGQACSQRINKCDRVKGWDDGGIVESGERGHKGGGGVIWQSLVLQVKPRHVFAVVAAFTLMMQFPCLPACQLLSVTAVLIRAPLCHAHPG